jgi:hypothetical protein
MLEMTDAARRRLERYMEEARRALAARPRPEADEVLRGLREHVDVELGARGAAGESVSAGELEEVLERLGTPESLAEVARAESSHAVPARWTALAALGLLLASALLLAAGRALPVAFVLVLAGLVLGRLSLGSETTAGAAEPAGRMLRLLLVGAVTALLVALLLAPTVLVWSQAQIGGFIDAARNPGAPPLPGTRPGSYWVYITGLAALITGLWWLLAGAACARWTVAARRAVGPLPLRIASRHGRILAGAGLVLAAAGLLVILL